MKALRAFPAFLATAALAAACGGGGKGLGGGGGGNTGPTGPNVQAVQVNLGPDGNYLNGIFTSVTICTPGSSSQCATVGNILVDTGSYGLRLLASTLNGSGVSLPGQASGSGDLGECLLFADNTYTWGPVVAADVRLGTSEVASNLPVNLIGTPSGSSFTSTPPSSCSNPSNDAAGAPTAANTVATLGANGILGVGAFGPDCGSSCATNPANGNYYSCGASGCSGVSVAEASQVQNPVGYFAGDNNGAILELPGISSGGAQTVNGSLVFGIGTQSNNGLGSALIIYANSVGEFSTTYKGSNYPNSFIDSGSNTLGFSDSSIPTCNDRPDFYCPSSTLNLSATMTGTNNGNVTVPFAVANADNLLKSGNAAYNDIAATNSALISSSFDWGLPFFYGFNVFVAMDGKSTPGGNGPYYAF